MKKCLNCDISVGGTGSTCPLCLNLLSGEDSPYLWPPAKKLRQQTFLYKLQKFIVLTTIAICCVLDFLLDLRGDIHWSLIVAMWLISFELILSSLIRGTLFVPKFLTLSAFQVSIMLAITGWYAGFLGPVVHYVIPIILSIMLLLNFIFSLTDKTENAMVYLLGNIVVAIIPYVVQFVIKGKKFASYAWVVCLIISIITFIGIAVFKGGKLMGEVQKRMHV